MSRRRDSSQDKQERVSRKQFGEYLEQNEWITADIVPDKGEDILVRIYDNGKSTGLSLYIQLKSVQIVENLKLKSGVISYSFEVADLEHWENQNPPVLLVVWDVSDRRGWWAWAGDAVKILDQRNAGWRSKSKVQVHFPPENSLDEDGLNRIRHKLADLYYLIIAKDKPLNIQTKFVFPQTPEGRAKLAEFERHLAVGDEIELDGQFIEQFELPEWWRRIYGEMDPKTMYVKIGPTKSAEEHPVQLDFFSPESGSERIPYVEFRAVKQGQEEITLSNEHQSIDPKFTLRINYKTRECNITFNFQHYRVDSLALLQMLRIHKILTKGCTVRITLLKTGSFDSLTVPPATIPAPPDKLIKYVENLVAIQQCSGRVLKLTDEASFSIENVRNAEELLSIYNSGSHKQNRLIFTIELRRPGIEQVVEAHKKGESLHFRLITEESYIELLGEHFDLGPMTQYITGKWEMPVEEVLAWLEKAGEDDALQVRLVDAELYEEFENWMRENCSHEQTRHGRATMIERLIQLEEDIRYQEFATADEPEFVHVKGSIPILISAPHGAAHTRNGKRKDEDEFTGGIAQLIGQETGAHVLYARRKSSTDPNVDPDAPYKQKIAEIVNKHQISFVLDIHGIRADRNCGIELGTAHGKSCTEKDRNLIIQILQEHGFVQNSSDRLQNLWIDQENAGAGRDGEERIIGFVWKKLHVPAAQFELNAHLRIPQRRADASPDDKSFKGDPELIVRTVQAFTALVARLADQYSLSLSK